jgi:hypothetical protein
MSHPRGRDWAKPSNVLFVYEAIVRIVALCRFKDRLDTRPRDLYLEITLSRSFHVFSLARGCNRRVTTQRSYVQADANQLLSKWQAFGWLVVEVGYGCRVYAYPLSKRVIAVVAFSPFHPSHFETLHMSDDLSVLIRRVNPPELGTPPGYSHVVEVRAGHLIFIAGQTALDQNGQIWHVAFGIPRLLCRGMRPDVTLGVQR